MNGEYRHCRRSIDSPQIHHDNINNDDLALKRGYRDPRIGVVFIPVAQPAERAHLVDPKIDFLVQSRLIELMSSFQAAPDLFSIDGDVEKQSWRFHASGLSEVRIPF